MIEVRFHGRGGQGAVTAAEILAKAAFEDGKYCQAFPFFGVERRGAPVMAFTRIDNKPIRRRYQVYNPDYVVVLDDGLLEVVDVFSGLKEGGKLIINTNNGVETTNGVEINKVDATGIALDILGVPIVNTILIGAFAGVTGEVSIESLIKIINETFSGSVAEKNDKAAKIAYDAAKKG